MHRRILLVLLLLFSLSCNLTTTLTSGGDKNGGSGGNPTASTSTSSSSPLSAMFKEVNGTVQARQPDQPDFANAGVGLTLQVLGLVKTGNDGRARLDLSSGTIIRVGPATVFTLTDNQAADNSLVTKIKLEVGKLWIVLNGGRLDLDTPSGQAGVRGSYLSVAVDPNTMGVYVTCLEGTCSVQNPAGQLDLTMDQTGTLLPPVNNIYSAPRLGAMTHEDYLDWKANVPEAASLIPADLPTPVPANVPCVITLSGAVSKTLPCSVQFVYSATEGLTNLIIVSNTQITTVTTLSEAQFIAQLPNDVQPGTYTTEGKQAAYVYESLTQAWLRDSQDGIGTSSVILASLSVEFTSAQGISYIAHGIITATLEAQGDAVGTVTMTITY